MRCVVERRARLRAAVIVCALLVGSTGCTDERRAGAAGGEGSLDSPSRSTAATTSPGDTQGGSGTRARGDQETVPEPVALPSAPVAHLDPNARYATTYRPGGAALAAFDSAIARGQIPASYKDLVADFGARYAPALERPAEGALSVAVDTERRSIGPAGGPVNLRVAITSSDATPSRAPLSVHIVLDTSGSMSGGAIDDARRAAEAVVNKLAPTDDFSMVTFSDTAHLLVAEGPVGPRRDAAIARIHEVRADGGTNISSGLDLGYAQAHGAGVPQDAVRIVMLLSDGHANGGDTDPQHLAQRAADAFQEGVQTSSFGLGTDFDAALMSRIADRGAGGYYYLADSSQIAPALAREIDARLQPVATAVELRVRLRPDVAATKVFGSRELSSPEAAAVRAQEVAVDQQERKRGIGTDRELDSAGGMRFFIPAFARADRHATLLTLQLPAGTGERSIASVEVRYKDRLLSKNVTRELPVKMKWAASDAESAATEDAGVERMALAFAAGETILDAAERVDHGDRAGAVRGLEERAAVLKQASETLHEPMLAEDGARLVRLSGAVGGTEALSDPLPLVVMLRGTGYGYL
jgi:Ca-activated chloride channel family protein